jgi:hypothetical protein
LAWLGSGRRSHPVSLPVYIRGGRKIVFGGGDYYCQSGARTKCIQAFDDFTTVTASEKTRHCLSSFSANHPLLSTRHVFALRRRHIGFDDSSHSHHLNPTGSETQIRTNMADASTEIDLDSIIDRLLEGEL